MNSTTEDSFRILLDSAVISVSFGLTVTLPANTYVLWLILQENRLSADICYFNLSLEEVVFSLSIMSGSLCAVYQCFPCIQIFASFRGLFLTGRPLFQCLICLECYLGVNHPVLFRRLRPLKCRLTCCAVSWLLVSFSCVYSYYTYTNPPHLFTIFIQNLFFLFLVLFCLISVLWYLKRPGPGEQSAQKKSNRTKVRAFRILSVTMANMTINFLFCMVPIPLQLCLPQLEYWLVLTMCTLISFVIGSTLPLIYLQRTGKHLCIHLHLH